MKLNKLIFLNICAAAVLAAGCEEANPTYTPATEGEEVTYDMSGFVRGADISWVTQMESEGEVFYNSDGVETECTELMREIGMNAVRYRVWVDPEDGWCNKSDVLAKCLRAQKLGLRIMIDFHYSDTWADPSAQLIPEAWLDYDTAGLTQAVSDHTTEVLSALKNAGIDVEWVQVGNEVTHGMLRHSSEDADGNTTLSEYGGDVYNYPANFAAFVDAGYDAVKSVYSDAQVVVHVDRGHEISYANRIFTALNTYGASYDIIGLSLYPNSSSWTDRTSTCVSNITTLYNTFGHDVMICETGMDYSDPDAAYAMLSYLLENSEATGHCLGVFYWEPEAPAGYNGGYSMGAFENGAPTHALDAFTEAAGL